MQRDLTLAFPCEQTLAVLMAALACHDIRLERSFDLRSALQDQADCPCPHHGTTSCTCQYVVLLAYEAAGPPTVITAHECDGITRVHVSCEQGGKLSWPLLAALDEALTGVTTDT